MPQPVRARRLTDEEGRRLLQIVRRGKHGSVRVRRAMIIMASASGTLVPTIARLVAAERKLIRQRGTDLRRLTVSRARCLTGPSMARTTFGSDPVARADVAALCPGRRMVSM
jgi:hypothetical protein